MTLKPNQLVFTSSEVYHRVAKRVHPQRRNYEIARFQNNVLFIGELVLEGFWFRYYIQA